MTAGAFRGTRGVAGHDLVGRKKREHLRLVTLLMRGRDHSRSHTANEGGITVLRFRKAGVILTLPLVVGTLTPLAARAQTATSSGNNPIPAREAAILAQNNTAEAEVHITR